MRGMTKRSFRIYRWWRWGVLAVAVTACGGAQSPVSGPSRAGASAATAVAALDLTVSDAAAARAFFTRQLGFQPTEGSDRIALGSEQVELTAHSTRGRAIPEDWRSNDLWFEHIAIVVSDMDAAYAKVVAAGVRPISTHGPQTIPLSNPGAGGIRAFYFKDPDGHALELIWYPPGKGNPRWQQHDERLFLGIDHSAIGVSNTERSLAFYRDLLGLEVKGGGVNEGTEQAQLSGVPGARVRITGLGGASGPGVEFLEYLAPTDGRPAPADTKPEDLWYWEIVVVVPNRAALAERLRAAGFPIENAARGLITRDPDGHHIRLVEREPEHGK